MLCDSARDRSGIVLAGGSLPEAPVVKRFREGSTDLLERMSKLQLLLH